MMHTLPDAPSVARNRAPILEVLREHFANSHKVLEIGSGTGQHAIHFAAALPHLLWQCSDRADALPGISAWLASAARPNTPAPLALDVSAPWPAQGFNALFSANTLHIMRWQDVENLFRNIPTALESPARVVIYGPFNYGGRYTSAGNAEFDQWLKARDAHQGIRDFEAVCALAADAGLQLIEDRAMPANNRCLVWQR
jgi:hypothetical protein